MTGLNFPPPTTMTIPASALLSKPHLLSFPHEHPGVLPAKREDTPRDFTAFRTEDMAAVILIICVVVAVVPMYSIPFPVPGVSRADSFFLLRVAVWNHRRRQRQRRCALNQLLAIDRGGVTSSPFGAMKPRVQRDAYRKLEGVAKRSGSTGPNGPGETVVACAICLSAVTGAATSGTLALTETITPLPRVTPPKRALLPDRWRRRSRGGTKYAIGEAHGWARDDDVMTLCTCGHAFHADCILRWFLLGKYDCPLCKGMYYLPKRTAQDQLLAVSPMPSRRGRS